MEFHLECTPAVFEKKISHQQKLFLAGSCFTEQIGAKLSALKFQTIENPNGILFNPVSITNSIYAYIQNRQYNGDNLFFHQDLWGSWDHHTRFSHISKEECLKAINLSQSRAHAFLEKADWLMITLGSAFVYELENRRVVANCHKVPTDKFQKRLLEITEIEELLKQMTGQLHDFNPGLNIIFTISPVRHLRDGFVENNRSKARLNHAVHTLVESRKQCFYFPAYELVIDDLRDYRFYAEDMVHPNYAATNYVWEKFTEACIDEPSRKLMKEIAVINAARNHRPFNPGSAQHKKFLEQHFEKASHLQEQYPYLDLSDELAYFQRFSD